MGVFLTDRATGVVHGVSSRLFAFLGDALAALGAEHVDVAWRREGYVPSWLARRWGATLFEQLEELVVVTRPVPDKGTQLRPIAVYRRGNPAGDSWRLMGEQVSVYDTTAAMAVLAFAQFCSTSTGFTTTTLRPPAEGSSRSHIAARRWLVQSGLFEPMPNTGRRSGVRPTTKGKSERGST